MPGIKPRTAESEARTLPLCFDVPPFRKKTLIRFCFTTGGLFRLSNMLPTLLATTGAIIRRFSNCQMSLFEKWSRLMDIKSLESNKSIRHTTKSTKAIWDSFSWFGSTRVGSFGIYWCNWRVHNTQSNEAPSDINTKLEGSTYTRWKMCHFIPADFIL